MKQKLTGADLKPDLQKAERELEDLLDRAEALREWIAATKKLSGKRVNLAENQAIPISPRRRTKTAELAEHVIEVLRRTGRPMHVNLIAIELSRKGYQVKAKNPAATVAVALGRRPDQFSRVGPNTFDLVSKEATVVAG
jgi:hypothetical protein